MIPIRKLIWIIILTLGLLGCPKPQSRILRDGDIVFQTSTSAQSRAIQAATHSKYSHMGMIYIQNNRCYVFEAVQPVKLTPFEDWVKRGKDGHYVAKRLIDAEKFLTPGVLAKMKQEGSKFLGKNYDLSFHWSDDELYCSELVWKIYKNALDIEIGKLQRLKEFDLSKPVVKAKLQERYGNHIPLNQWVISPAQMFQSSRLETVFQK